MQRGHLLEKVVETGPAPWVITALPSPSAHCHAGALNGYVWGTAEDHSRTYSNTHAYTPRTADIVCRVCGLRIESCD